MNKTAFPPLILTGPQAAFGQTKSGKSYLASQMIKAANPPQVVIIDPVARDGLTMPQEVTKALKAGKRRIVLKGTNRDRQIGTILRAAGHSTLAKPVFLVCDEAITAHKPKSPIGCV